MRLLQSKRGQGVAGPVDEILLFVLILIFVFGYSPMEAMSLTGRISYWVFVLFLAPIAAVFLSHLLFDPEPIGGDHDHWWDGYARQVHVTAGTENLNKLTITEARHPDHHYAYRTL